MSSLVFHLQFLQKQLRIAIPSGILCIVIAEINSILLFNDSELFNPFLFFNVLSRNLSDNRTNMPPIAKPAAGSTHSMYPSSPDKSIAGASKDQNEAAIITPALKPKIVLSTFLLTCLKKQTTNAPNAVIPHVNIVANNVCNTGSKLSNQANFYHLILHNMFSCYIMLQYF